MMNSNRYSLLYQCVIFFTLICTVICLSENTIIVCEQTRHCPSCHTCRLPERSCVHVRDYTDPYRDCVDASFCQTEFVCIGGHCSPAILPTCTCNKTSGKCLKEPLSTSLNKSAYIQPHLNGVHGPDGTGKKGGHQDSIKSALVIGASVVIISMIILFIVLVGKRKSGGITRVVYSEVYGKQSLFTDCFPFWNNPKRENAYVITYVDPKDRLKKLREIEI